MLSTRLGDTDHTVTRIGLGLAALGRPGYINLGHKSDLTGRTEVKALEAHAHEVLTAAYDAGIRSRLGRHVDIYQIHSATTDSGVLENDEVLDRLGKIRSEGVTIGLSTSGPNQADTIRQAMTIERDGVPLFSTVQSTWNLLEPSAGPALAEAHDAGMGVIIKESVANGRLTERDRTTTAPLREAFPSTNADTVAVAAILAQPWVDAVLSGAATVEQLDSNLDPDSLRDMPPMAEDPAEYWRTRSELKWT